MLSAFPRPKSGRIRKTESDPTTTIFHTIGYEQNEPQAFIKMLLAHKVAVVVDVRQMPLSRKKGFSKNQLRELLETGGIQYVHFQSLGAPKEIRDRLKENGSWWEYVKGYEKVLASRGEEIENLVEFAKGRKICLLCFERKPEECHRSLVAKEMEKRGIQDSLRVNHIRY